MPAGGASLIASKIDAIASNPDVWAKTVFIVNWDENDGLFDHVPPITPPAGTPDEFVTAKSPAGTPGNGLNVGSGFRVPCLIVSPWTQGGYVCSEPFDHTSTLRFVEEVTGVRVPMLSDWRRSAFGDLTSAFRFNHADHNTPTLPDTNGPLNLATYETSQFKLPAFPSDNQTVPVQEKGNRKRVP
jgi:phospholipase C